MTNIIDYSKQPTTKYFIQFYHPMLFISIWFICVGKYDRKKAFILQKHIHMLHRADFPYTDGDNC